MNKIFLQLMCFALTPTVLIAGDSIKNEIRKELKKLDAHVTEYAYSSDTLKASLKKITILVL